MSATTWTWAGRSPCRGASASPARAGAHDKEGGGALWCEGCVIVVALAAGDVVRTLEVSRPAIDIPRPAVESIHFGPYRGTAR
jgi:hypothetical protein